MIEDEVDKAIVLVDADMLLAGNKGEPGAQLQQESLQMGDEFRRFPIPHSLGDELPSGWDRPDKIVKNTEGL